MTIGSLITGALVSSTVNAVNCALVFPEVSLAIIIMEYLPFLAGLKDSELMLKGGLCNIIIEKNPDIHSKLEKLQFIVEVNKGDTLNVMYANAEVRILINEKYKQKALEILGGEKVLIIEEDLAAIIVRVAHNYQRVPGIIFRFLKPLALMNISVVEMISAFYEMTLVVSKQDAPKGYRALQDYIDSS